MNKKQERFFVEEAGKRLCATWQLGPNRESPDFLIAEGTHEFGLEVSEVFMGKRGPNGSAMKRQESENQRAIDALRAEYEAVADDPLRVQFTGDLSADNMAAVVPALVAADFAARPILHQERIEPGDRFALHVTKALRAEWFNVGDRVGWVDPDPTQCIADAVEAKSRKLPAYIAAAGSDVRLLLVADRHFNSGKLVLDERHVLDRRGFRAVYFFSYPDGVVVFD